MFPREKYSLVASGEINICKLSERESLTLPRHSDCVYFSITIANFIVILQ